MNANPGGGKFRRSGGEHQQTTFGTGKLELACSVKFLQFLDEAPPEQSGQHTYWQEEPMTAGKPVFSVSGDATARYDAMNVWMVCQC